MSHRHIVYTPLLRQPSGSITKARVTIVKSRGPLAPNAAADKAYCQTSWYASFLHWWPPRTLTTWRPHVGSVAWASGNSAKVNGPPARSGATAPRGAWAKPLASARSDAFATPTPPVTPNMWSSSGIPKANALVPSYARVAAVPASSSTSPTRPPASVNGSATARGGSGVRSSAEAVVEAFKDRKRCLPTSQSVALPVGSQISPVPDSHSLAETETNLASSDLKIANNSRPITVMEQPNAADGIAEHENAWATTEPDDKDDIMERAKCPAHQKLCNPNVCAMIGLHCKNLGINYRDLKLGGPSNIYTMDRGQ